MIACIFTLQFQMYKYLPNEGTVHTTGSKTWDHFFGGRIATGTATVAANDNVSTATISDLRIPPQYRPTAPPTRPRRTSLTVPESRHGVSLMGSGPAWLATPDPFRPEASARAATSAASSGPASSSGAAERSMLRRRDARDIEILAETVTLGV